MSATASHSLARILLRFMGSMPLAITLLVAVAIASVIGTVLQQNQPYNDYVIKFGPFWFEFFKTLQLFDVYHALWFLFLLAFLVVSTSVCIWQNTPLMLREVRNWRSGITDKSLRAMKLHDEWDDGAPAQQTADRAQRLLAAHGYRTRMEKGQDHLSIAAKKGGSNRYGYILTHVAIVVICLGGLLDGNLPILLGERLGKIRIETRNLTVNEVGPETRLPPGNLSFRGNISIPEGETANFLFLNIRDGFLVQQLPFSVEVKDFRIEHYDNGQPKSFESDLVVHDPELPEPIEQTIAVNHPLSHRGITIYQASFSDGGSRLKIKAWPLRGPSDETVTLDGTVNRTTRMGTPEGEYAIEVEDFRLFNIHNVAQQVDAKEFKNIGPSFQYKLRRADGRALEYNNYMSPVVVEGRQFMLTGVRTTPSEEFRYLHLPVGPDGSLNRFMRYLALLHDDGSLRSLATRIADVTLSVSKSQDPQLRQSVIEKTVQLGKMFREGGFVAIEQAANEAFPEDKRSDGFRAYMNIVRVQLAALYENVLKQEGGYRDERLSPEQERFYEDAVIALAGLPDYDAPAYLQLESFEHVQATGLEMTRSPGKYVVYLGCALLIAGVFMLFYIHPRRIWLRVRGTGVLLGGADLRTLPDFAREFRALADAIRARPQAS